MLISHRKILKDLPSTDFSRKAATRLEHSLVSRNWDTFCRKGTDKVISFAIVGRHIVQNNYIFSCGQDGYLCGPRQDVQIVVTGSWGDVS